MLAPSSLTIQRASLWSQLVGMGYGVLTSLEGVMEFREGQGLGTPGTSLCASLHTPPPSLAP